MVNRSSSPCVGCAWRPSPAFTTCSCGLTCRAMRYGAPAELWRTTKMSACMADKFATVSSSDSPFDCEDTAMLRLMTSAERRLAAISKVVRVRVDGSKNRLNTLLPRNSGTFFTSRSVTPTNDSAVSRICTRTSRGRPSMDSRCCNSPFALSWGLRCIFGLEGEGKVSRSVALQSQAHPRGHLDTRAAVLRADRQLPPAAVGEHDQRDARRAAIVEHLVHRRAHRAPGEEHVVDQQQLAAVDVERDLGALRVVMQALRVIVVAVERDVHQPQGRRDAEPGMQPLGEPRAARVYADHRRLGADDGLQRLQQFLAEALGVRQFRHRKTARVSVAPRPSRRLFA